MYFRERELEMRAHHGELVSHANAEREKRKEKKKRSLHECCELVSGLSVRFLRCILAVDVLARPGNPGSTVIRQITSLQASPFVSSRVTAFNK